MTRAFLCYCSFTIRLRPVINLILSASSSSCILFFKFLGVNLFLTASEANVSLVLKARKMKSFNSDGLFSKALASLFFILLLALEIKADKNDELIRYTLLKDRAKVISLLNTGANINTQSANDGGATPLILATKFGDTSMALLFIDRRASLDIQDKHGQTALLWAASFDQLDIARALLRWGASINIATVTGNTPLHAATSKNNRNSVALLLDKGADVKIKNNEGLTAYDVAVKAGLADIANMLKNADVNCNAGTLTTLLDKVSDLSLKNNALTTRVNELEVELLKKNVDCLKRP